jgi:hypothetical protein
MLSYHSNIRTCPERRHIVRTHSEDEWNALKPLIRTLYIEQAFTLPEVMDELAKTKNFLSTLVIYYSNEFLSPPFFFLCHCPCS